MTKIIYDHNNLPLSPKKPLKKTLSVSMSLIPPIFMLSIFGAIGISQLNVGFGTLLLSFIGLLVLFTALFGGGTYVYQYYYYKLYSYSFDEEQGEIQKGVISRSKGFVKYVRLQNIYVDQDILDRIFGLYDVHYETAGETSAFYSHVDGLSKENADKLIAFLNKKAIGKNSKHDTKKNDAMGSGSIRKLRAKSIISTSKTAKTKVSDLTIADCPLSPNYLVGTVIGSVVGLLILCIFICSWILLGIRGSDLSDFYIFVVGCVSVFIVLIVWTYIYQIIWMKNYFFSFGQDKGEIRTKVIAQSTTYLYYDRIQNVTVSQGIIDRIFKMSNVLVETAGDMSGISIRGLSVESANKLRDFILEKAKSYRGGRL